MLFWRLLFYSSLLCDLLLSESGGSVNNHPPAVTGSIFTCSICKFEQPQPAGVAFPNWLSVPKWSFSYEAVLSSATWKGVFSLPFGYVQSKWWCRQNFIHRRELVIGLLVLTHENSGTFSVSLYVDGSDHNSHLFWSGDSRFPIAVFFLLALVLSHVVMEHFKVKGTNAKGSGSGSWKWPVPW